MEQKSIGDFISVTEASEKYEFDPAYVRYLIRCGRIGGVKFGRTWAVDVASLEAYLASDRKRGRRSKTAS